ncbi:hypothetical protein NDU88_000924 [Pleurodeles waltl]|uniref:Uncharacterized protein n=1 Tax=Pleurodeles waltl TaxID=8319 RepID=A0AAV7LXR2_PLEWA|nr:hypothetical protein NDU88_000924 [Pleurodeles waltl]
MYRPPYHNSPIRHLFRGGAPPIKTRRKQTTNGKTLTSIHSTRKEDSMEPELNILPAIVYLLIYHEYERRRRRQRCITDSTGIGGGMVPRVLREHQLDTEPALSMGQRCLRWRGPAERCLTGRAQRSGA